MRRLVGLLLCFLYLFGSLLAGTCAEERKEDSPLCKRPTRDPLSPEGKRVLVTGAAGFIGSHVARVCANLGMEVVAVDDLSGGFTENIPSGVTFVMGDLQDDDFLLGLFEHYGPFEYVYHLAAYAAEGLSHFIRGFNYRNNLVASVQLLNHSVRTGVKVYVFTSSIAVYGTNQIPMTEDTVPLPEDPYGISKYAMELDLKAAHEMFGIDFVIFRPHNVYGPNQNIFDKYRNVIGIFMYQIQHGLPMTIFGDGEQTRAFSYIDDVAPVISKAPLYPDSYGEAYNIGADRPYSLNELATEVARVMDVPRDVVHLDARNEVVHAVSDHSKVKCMFSPPPATDLKTGLSNMALWLRFVGKNYHPIDFENVELLQNMPRSWVTENLRSNYENRYGDDSKWNALRMKATPGAATPAAQAGVETPNPFRDATDGMMSTGVPAPFSDIEKVCIVVRSYNGHSDSEIFNLRKMLTTLTHLNHKNWAALVFNADDGDFPEMYDVVASFADPRMKVVEVDRRFREKFHPATNAYRATDEAIHACTEHAPDAYWLLVTNGDNLYLPQFLDFLDPSYDVIGVGFRSRYFAWRSQRKDNQIVSHDLRCHRFPADDICAFNSLEYGYTDLGAMVWSRLALFEANATFSALTVMCPSCQDAAMAHILTKVEDRRGKGISVCGMFHNPTPLACFQEGGTWFDSPKLSEQRCYAREEVQEMLAARPGDVEEVTVRLNEQSDGVGSVATCMRYTEAAYAFQVEDANRENRERSADHNRVVDSVVSPRLDFYGFDKRIRQDVLDDFFPRKRKQSGEKQG